MDVLVSDRRFTEFADEEGSGGRGVAHDAGWPHPIYAVGLDDLADEVSEVDLCSVLANEFPFFVGFVLGWTARGTVVDGLLAVVAPGEVLVWLVVDEESPCIAVDDALGLGFSAAGPVVF